MKIINTKQGITLVTALAMMVLLFTAGIAYMIFIRTETRITINQFESLKSLAYADGGIEYAIGEITNGTSFVDWYIDYNIDSSDDVYVTSDSLNKTINSVTNVNPIRNISINYNDSGFTSALKSGQQFNDNSSTLIGWIKGNLDAGYLNGMDQLDVVGTVSDHQQDISGYIPIPDFNAYETNATTVYGPSPYTIYTDLGPGIHYINGSFIIDGSNITIDGSLVATGDITILTSADSLTINPSGNNPAIVAGGDIIIGSTVTFYTLNFKGLVYGTNINISYCNGMTVEGAIVAQQNLDFTEVQGFIVNYDPNIDPPYFSGGDKGNIVVVSWKGHNQF